MCNKTPTELLNDFISFVVRQSYQDEEWREMPNTNGTYFLSNYGRILALNRKEPYLRKFDTNNPSHYRRIGISINKKRKVYHVHLLVAQFFVGDIDGKQVHHKNGDRLDNRACNLQVLTREEHERIHNRPIPRICHYDKGDEQY